MNESPTDGRRLAPGITWPHLAVLLTVLLTYGFELFNFNVSADEPIFWNYSRMEMMEIWNGQGRWGMGLATWLLPSTNVPLVPLALGLTATTISLWWLARRELELSEWEAAFATSLAISLPALVFHFSYSINSLGLGIAYASCVAAGALVRRGGLLSLVGAVVLGALAIGVYEGFAFVLVTVLAVVIWSNPTWAVVLRTGVIFVASTVVWFALNQLVTLNVPAERSGYVGSILGLDGIAEDPLGRAADAVYRMVGIILERWLYFGYTNPLPAFVLAVVFVCAVIAAVSRPRHERLVSLLVLLGLVAIPLVGAFLTKVLFQRSMVFLPPIFILACGFGLPVLRRFLHTAVGGALVVVGVLAIAGQATLANGAFYSGTVVVDDDMAVVSDIAATYRSLPTSFEGPLPVVLLPRAETFSRPDNWSARSSFEAGVMGSASDATPYLQMRGLDVLSPTDEEIERGTTILESMPAYPQPGYLAVKDGLLLINLSTVDNR